MFNGREHLNRNVLLLFYVHVIVDWKSSIVFACRYINIIFCPMHCRSDHIRLRKESPSLFSTRRIGVVILSKTRNRIDIIWWYKGDLDAIVVRLLYTSIIITWKTWNSNRDIFELKTILYAIKNVRRLSLKHFWIIFLFFFFLTFILL